MTTPSGPELLVVDSSGWVEFLGDGPRAAAFEPYMQYLDRLVVPTIVMYEIVKKLLGTRGETEADAFISHVLRARVVPLDESLAQVAAQFSLRYRLGMVDAIIYATARTCEAELVTSDRHFRDLPGVTLIES